MSLRKFQVVIAHNHLYDGRTIFGVRQPGCTNRSIKVCQAQHHRWCQDIPNHRAAMTIARILATYRIINPQIGLTK